MMKWLLAFCIAFYGIALFCEKQTDDFSLAYIQSDLLPCPEWETHSPSPEVKHVLSQSFHYLGCGGQAYAFVSDDNQYVIKFFKQRDFRKPHRLLLSLPRPGILELARLHKYTKALSKLRRDFSSYKLAYEALPEESGLVYVHLNKGSDLKQSLAITDKLGITHTIDLDNVEFVLQKKASPLFPRIQTQMEHGDLAGAKQTIHAIVEVLVGRCQKGIFDEDPRLHNNMGVIGTSAMFIDVGRFVRDPQRTHPETYKEDLKHITGKRLKPWLEENYPELSAYLDEKIENCGTL